MIKPSNQKGVYNNFAIVYQMIMEKTIGVGEAEVAINALSGMNRTFALELKRAQLTEEPIRNVEAFNFEEVDRK